jgi:hypothetical protein
MKELEDLRWFPSLLRNFQTTFIGFVVTRFGFYKPFIQYLNNLQLSPKPLTDLCSGSGEPAMYIFNQSNCFTGLLLTDKYPNTKPDTAKIIYRQEPVDVLHMEFKPDSYYTMFNSFHHFSDAEKQQLAKKMRESNTHIFCVEILEPTFFCLLKVMLMTTVGCILLTPFIRPFSFSRLLFTYIIPVNILTIAADGIVSVFKSRSVKQYKTLLVQHDPNTRIERFSNCLSTIIVIHIHPTI